MRKSAIVIAFVAASTVATSAFAINAASQPQPATIDLAQAQPPAPRDAQRGESENRDRRMHGSRHGDGPMHRAHRGGQRFAMKLAERLAAAEVAIGVRSDQLDTWRAFTSAAVDFVTPSRRGGPRPAAAGEQSDERREDRPRGMLDMADRMADRTIDRAEKAKTLKSAVDALRQKLSPEQVAKLESLPLGPGHRGMKGRHGPGERSPHGSGPR